MDHESTKDNDRRGTVYEDLTDEMAAGAIAAIEACGGTYERFAVQGVQDSATIKLPFEAWILTRVAVSLTVMLLWAASSEAKPRITIMFASARGLTNLAINMLAIGYGILTTENREQGPGHRGCRQQKGRCGERLS